MSWSCRSTTFPIYIGHVNGLPDFAGLDMSAVGTVPTAAWCGHALVISAAVMLEHARCDDNYHAVTCYWGRRGRFARADK